MGRELNERWISEIRHWVENGSQGIDRDTAHLPRCCFKLLSGVVLQAHPTENLMRPHVVGD